MAEVRTEEQKLASETAAERTEALPVSSDALSSPEALLKSETAKVELQRLELRQVGDLLEALDRSYDQKLKELDKRIQSQDNLIKQLLQLHKMLMEDVEAQFEILKVFQSELVVLEEVRGEGTLPAAKQ
ncbi:hypothetical protein [Thiomonas sp.]